jgi:hypothetical protein
LLVQGAAHQHNDKRFGLAEYSYDAVNATTVSVQGIAYTPFIDYRSYFVGRYRVFTKSVKPISKPKELFYLDLARKLCVCVESPAAPDRCLEIKYVRDIPASLLDQTKISVDPSAIVQDLPNRAFSTDVGLKGQLANDVFGPASAQDTSFTAQAGSKEDTSYTINRRAENIAAKEFVRQLHFTLSTSGNRQAIPIQLSDSDFVVNLILKSMPNEYLDKPIVNFKKLNKKVLKGFSENCSVRDALKSDLSKFSLMTGLSYDDAIIERRKLIGLQSQKSK